MNIKEIKSIAIGSFDGIHSAHRHLIDQADGVVIIERGAGYLTPGFRRYLYTSKPLFFYFLETIKGLGATEFTERLKRDFPALETIIVGYDFRFGQGRESNAQRLRDMFDGDVVIVDEVLIDSVSVHSRVIREYLQNGDIQTANKFLGRKYRIAGEVIRGQGLGAKELVPTLNLKVLDYQLPLEGVYATRTKIEDSWHISVSFIGHRVTTDGSFAVESHIIDNDIGEVSGEVEIEFVGRIRDNKRFDSLEHLKEQIAADIDSAKNWKTDER